MLDGKKVYIEAHVDHDSGEDRPDELRYLQLRLKDGQTIQTNIGNIDVKARKKPPEDK